MNPYPNQNEAQLTAAIRSLAKILNFTLPKDHSPPSSYQLFGIVAGQVSLDNLGHGVFRIARTTRLGHRLSVQISTYEPTPEVKAQIIRNRMQYELRMLHSADGTINVREKPESTFWLRLCLLIDPETRPIVTIAKRRRRLPWEFISRWVRCSST